MKMMPPFLPFPEALVYISGVFEIGLGVALMIQKSRHWAALGVIALLIAVFPANIYMSIDPEKFNFPVIMLYVRLPLQFLLMYWAYSFTDYYKKNKKELRPPSA